MAAKPHQSAPANTSDVARKRLEKALGYPYHSPASSFVLDTATQNVDLIEDQEVASLLPGREPMLAIGSNAAPEQLIWKFHGRTQDPLVIAAQVSVKDHDVVFCNHVSRYGAIPATITPCPGTTVDLKVLWCTPEQAEVLNGTESLGTGYAIKQLDLTYMEASHPVQSALQGYEVLHYYEAIMGPMLLDGTPVSFESIRARGRIWPSKAESEMLQRLAPVAGYSSVDSMVDDVALGPTAWQQINAQFHAGELQLPSGADAPAPR